MERYGVHALAVSTLVRAYPYSAVSSSALAWPADRGYNEMDPAMNVPSPHFLVPVRGWLIACLALACRPTTPTASASASASEGLTSGDNSDSASATATTAEATSTGDMSTSRVTTAGFVSSADEANPGACDYVLQDCPRGEKCAFDLETSTSTCVSQDPDPDPVGAPCTGEPLPVLGGDDSCEAGAACWFVDSESHAGICVQLCRWPDGDPCPPTDACDLIGDANDIGLCKRRCDPLAPSCEAGLGCDIAESDDLPLCDWPAPGDGQFGDPCLPAVCASGLTCVSGDAVPCDGDACCTAFCDLDQPGSCEAKDPATACVAVYPPGRAPSGLGHLGRCLLP